MLIDLLLQFGEHLVQLLPPRVQLREVVDQHLVLTGHLHVVSVYLTHVDLLSGGNTHQHPSVEPSPKEEGDNYQQSNMMETDSQGILHINMLKICLLSLLLLTTLQLYSPTKLLLDGSPNAFAISQDLSTCVISSYSLQPGLLFYRNNGSTFRLAGRTPRDYPNTTTAQKIPQLSRDGSKLVSSYTDSYVRVYQLNEEKSELLQKIDVGTASTESYLSADGGVLVVANQGMSTIYQWDARKGLFSYLSNLTMGTVKAVSPDGRYIIDCNSTSTTNYIYPSYTSTTTTCQPYLNYLSPLTRTQYVRQHLSLPQGSTNYFHFSLAKRDENNYPILTLSQTTPALTYTLQYFLMKDGKITDLQNIATLTDQPSAITLSANGRSMAYGYDFQMFVYTLVNDKFVLSSQHWQLSTHTSPNCLFLSESGSFLAGSSYSGINYPDDPYAVFFFTNCIPPCLHCWPGKCLSCQLGFALIGDSCVCPSGTHLVAGICKVCPVDHCSRCASASQCEVCSRGFQLSEGQCFCGEGRSISIGSGHCVKCEIEGCSHCEVPNVCSKQNNLGSEETDAEAAEHSQMPQNHERSQKLEENQQKQADKSQTTLKQATIEMLQQADDQDAIIGTLIVSLIIFLIKACCTCLKNKCMRCLGIKEDKRETVEESSVKKEKDEVGGKIPYVEFSDEKADELQSEVKLEKIGGKNKRKRLENDETQH